MQASRTMTRDVTVVLPELTLANAWRVMMRERIRHLPVVRAGALIGMLSDRDVLARGTMGNDGILHVAPHAIVGDDVTPTPLVTCEASTDHPARELADGGKDRRRSSHGLRLVDLVTSTDLFAQEAQALSRSQGGLGLGLAIVHSLVRLHGGTVSARSEGLGQGSEFTIRLPASAATAVDPLAVAASREVSWLANRNGGASLAILVVDDNNDAADLLAMTLGAWGHTVRVAYDGPSALRATTDFAPVVALLDIGLPIMDGYELAQRLKQDPNLRHTRLVAVTGYGQETDRQRSRDAGFEVHLVKPIDMTALHTMVTNWAREGVASGPRD